MNHYTVFALVWVVNRCIGRSRGHRIGDMAPAKTSGSTMGFIRNVPTMLLAVLLIAGPESTLAASDTLPLEVTREYQESQERSRYGELLQEWGENKDLPPGFELQTLLALRHFPELKPVRIRFIVSDVSIPLASRPHWPSMLRSAPNRTYLVVIDDELDGPRDALLLKNQPFNAQIGIIGHELAHTVYYLERSFFGILGDALCQLNDCRIEFERATDRRLITYGLGWQRYDHARFLRDRFRSGEEDITAVEGGGGAYLGPNALLNLIEKNSIYADTAD